MRATALKLVIEFLLSAEVCHMAGPETSYSCLSQDPGEFWSLRILLLLRLSAYMPLVARW